MSQLENVPKKLKEFFAANNITQVEAAKRLNTTQQVVSRLLNGKPFGKRTASLWQEVYGLNPAWLLTGTGEMFVNGGAEECTAKKVVGLASEAVASEVLRLIKAGELYPASVVKAQEQALEAKEREIIRLNVELAKANAQLEQYAREKTGAKAKGVAVVEAELKEV